MGRATTTLSAITPARRYAPERFSLIRIAPNWFAPGVYDEHGAIYEAYKPEMTFEFTVRDGEAVSLEMLGEDDKVAATGHRKR